MNIEFEIDHIDPLGQGVSKRSEKVSFIRKTLPGEKGRAKILKSSKGVLFGEPESFTQESSRRVEPECPHFFECPSCHLLHTDWENESSIKLTTLQREVKKRLRHSSLLSEGLPEVQLHTSQQRWGYRSRIQLHYDLKKKRLGHIDALKKSIVEVPNCLIATPPIQAKIQELYTSQKWMQLLPPHAPAKGHLELTENSGQVDIVWNSAYASGGFTQVNQQMNEVLVELMTQKVQQLGPKGGIWDLFGGDGNLTQRVHDLPTLIADSGQKHPRQEGQRLFIKSNLYSDGVLEELIQQSKFTPELLLIDPPRSGFKQLGEFLHKLRPKNCLYVSCHQATQLRDLQGIPPEYKLKEVHLLELFASTYHFETVFLLQINDDKR